MNGLKLVPSVEENFFKDRCFSDQRLAGVNPFQIWRVTKEQGTDSDHRGWTKGVHVEPIILSLIVTEDIGVSWKSFIDEKLNKEFDWRGTFADALESKDNDALEKVNLHHYCHHHHRHLPLPSASASFVIIISPSSSSSSSLLSPYHHHYHHHHYRQHHRRCRRCHNYHRRFFIHHHSPIHFLTLGPPLRLYACSWYHSTFLGW